jgi:hypothetical protein
VTRRPVVGAARRFGSIAEELTEDAPGTLMPVTHDELLAAAVMLRRLLAVIDAGEVAASEAQRAYLAGAADTLDEIVGDRSEL